MRTVTALTLKWTVAFFTLLLYGQASGSVGAGEAAGIALAVAALSWVADRRLPFGLQGVTRWAIDSLLAGLTVYFAAALWPRPREPFVTAMVIGFFLGALELPLHFFLAARYGADGPEEEERDRLR